MTGTLKAWVAFCAALALFVALSSWLNPDVSWLLFAAERMMEGWAPYTGLWESNPPLILWIYLLPASAAKLLGVSSAYVFAAFVWLLALGSLGLCWSILSAPSRARLAGSSITLEGEGRGGGEWMPAMLAVLFMPLAAPVWGEREHLWMLLVMPYLLTSLRDAPQTRWTWRETGVALLAALGTALKPHFALLWLVNELALAARRRRAALLLRPANIAIALAGCAYLGAVWLITPQYYTFMLPLLLAAYPDFHHKSTGEILQFSAMLLAMFTLPLAWFRPRAPWPQALAWLLAAAAIMAGQRNLWANHYYPVLVMGGALLALPAGAAWNGRETSRRAFAALCYAAALPLALAAHALAQQWDDGDYRAQAQAMLAAAELYGAQGQPVAVLSPNLPDAFPAVYYAGLRFESRFHHLWFLPALVKSQASGPPYPRCPDEREMQIMPLRRQAVEGILQDFRRFPPALAWVAESFDFEGFLAHHPPLAALWRQYERVPLPPDSAEAMKRGFSLYRRRAEN